MVSKSGDAEAFYVCPLSIRTFCNQRKFDELATFDILLCPICQARLRSGQVHYHAGLVPVDLTKPRNLPRRL